MNENQRHIQILPDFIANQIAAGEVVQRPESVIKELVENSLDSGADNIAVIVRGAGKSLIHIVDNGHGMNREDLELASKRHATSKIFTSEDLEQINTFGFRGEALASIASVANLEIRSRTHDADTGWKLVSEPMKEQTTEPVSMDFGTQVFVRNLFFNVPARRKFLRSDLTEFRYISDTMIKFALAKPNIRFTFYDSDNLVFDAHPKDLQLRIGDILGKETGEGVIPVSAENDIIGITGFIGLPHLAKQSRTGQYLFLNGRSIISKSLSHAVFSAYEHLLEKNVNPLFVINIKIVPSRFDVNVHPQKHEVKFEDERLVYSMIHRAVVNSLQNHNLAPSAAFREDLSQTPFEKFSFTTSGQSDLMLVNKFTGEVVENKQEPAGFSGNYQGGSFRTPNPQEFQSHQVFGQNEMSAFDALFQKSENTPLPVEQVSPAIPSATMWQLHKKYIFYQTQQGLMIIDQHAAHERVLYERAIKAMNREFAYAQELLFPVKVTLNSSEMVLLKEISGELNNLGFRFREISGDQLELTSVPLDSVKGGETVSLKEILGEYAENQRIKHTGSRDNLAASYSCKAAIKTGQPLILQEMQKLISDLMKCEVPYACPHGRPVIIEFSLQEFDKRFGRI